MVLISSDSVHDSRHKPDRSVNEPHENLKGKKFLVCTTMRILGRMPRMFQIMSKLD